MFIGTIPTVSGHRYGARGLHGLHPEPLGLRQMFADSNPGGVTLSCRLMGSEPVEIELLPRLKEDSRRPVVRESVSL